MPSLSAVQFHAVSFEVLQCYVVYEALLKLCSGECPVDLYIEFDSVDSRHDVPLGGDVPRT